MRYFFLSDGPSSSKICVSGRHWTFVDAAHEFTSGASPFPYPQTRTVIFDDLVGHVAQDFTAIKIGDINFSRDNSQSGRTKTQEVLIQIGRPTETEEGFFEVELKTFGFIDIAGFQFTMAWNSSELEWIETVEHNDLLAQYGKHRLNDGLLTMIWDHPKGESMSLPENASVITLRFKKRAEAVNDGLSIDGQVTRLKMYDLDLKPVDLKVKLTDEERVESRKFYPNPFVSTTTLSFSASEAHTARFEVTDVMGRRVETLDVNVQKGWNEFNYNGSQLKAGPYLFNLRLNDRVIRAKAIKREK
jgi:hypothetical protein